MSKRPNAVVVEAAAAIAIAVVGVLSYRACRQPAAPPSAPAVARPAAPAVPQPRPDAPPADAPPAPLVALRGSPEPYPEHDFELRPPMKPWVEVPPFDARTVIAYARVDPAAGYAILVGKNKEGRTVRDWALRFSASIPGATMTETEVDGVKAADLSFKSALFGEAADGGAGEPPRAMRLRAMVANGRLYQLVAWADVKDEGLLEALAPLLFDGFKPSITRKPPGPR